MTYIDYLNRFNRWSESNDLPVFAVVLYYRLLDKFNRDLWPSSERVDTLRLMLMAGCQKDAAYRARDKLAEAGFIRFEKGRKGKATVYYLCSPEDRNPLEVPDRDKILSFKTSESTTKTSFLSFKTTESPTESPTETPTETATLRERNKTKTKNLCREQPPQAPASLPPEEPVVEFPLKDGTGYAVSPEQCQTWAGLYPAVDVIQQLRNMKGWLEANPTRRKSRAGVPRFVNAWLAREQNQANGADQRSAGTRERSAPGEKRSYNLADLESLSSFHLPEEL